MESIDTDKSKELQTAVELLKKGIISRKTFLEIADIDYDKELEKLKKGVGEVVPETIVSRFEILDL